MDRPKRVKRLIRCEVCGNLRRYAGSSKVWVDAVITNPYTGTKTSDGYLARICGDCRPKVGYAKRKKKKAGKVKSRN